MRFKPGARKTLQQSLRSHLAAREFYAPPVGDPRRAAYEASIASHKAMVKPVRVRKPEALDIDAIHRKQKSDDDAEKHVQREVGELLAKHPSVLLAVRQNSGGMRYEDTQRQEHVMWFYKFWRCPEKMTIVDYWGFFRDGKPYAIECKRRDWKWSDDPREIKQRAFLQMIEAIGGRSGFARGVEEAQAILA